MADDATAVSSARVLLLGVLLLGFGTLGFHEIPGMIAENAEGNKWINSLYCAVMTLTTVGYGDICPGQIDHVGRTFIVVLALSGLGMFCGPLLGLASSWKDQVPGGRLALLTTTIATAVFVFSYWLQEMSESEAAYFSIVTGTTIGYGDIHPRTDAGKLAVALYAIVAINVIAAVLEPAKEFLVSFCMVQPMAVAAKASKTRKDDKVDKKAKSRKDDNKPESATSDKSRSKKKQ